MTSGLDDRLNSRPRQYNGFTVDFHELERILNIPRDHRIVKVSVSSDHYVPGVQIIVEGPACQLVAERCAVAYDNLSRWLVNVDQVREQAVEAMGPYEW